MKININKLSESCYKWYCDLHNIECKPYHKMSINDIKTISNDIKDEISSLVENRNINTEMYINIIRLSNVLAYINGININRWITLSIDAESVNQL